MPMAVIDGTTVEFATWREIPVEDGIDEQRGVNGDLNAAVVYEKREWEGTVPCWDGAELSALIALADYPNDIPVYGDLLRIPLVGGAIQCKVRVTTRDFNHAASTAGFYVIANVSIKES